MRKSICNSINLVLIIIDTKIILKKLLDSPNLMKNQALYIYELTEVIMIYKHQNFVFATLQVMAPGLKDFNNG